MTGERTLPVAAFQSPGPALVVSLAARSLLHVHGAVATIVYLLQIVVSSWALSPASC